MATLNRTRRSAPIYTHEGAKAVRINTEQSLRRTVMACLLWENTFYEDGQSVADRIKDGVAKVSLQVAADIAVKAREESHLRHVPLLIVREMARKGGDKYAHLIGNTLARVIQRPDELTEFLAIYWADGKCPVSAQIKRGLAEAFGKFNEYSLAKYNRTNKNVTLRDVLFLTHPVAKDTDQQDLWNRLVEGTMDTPDTWETTLSAGGDKSAHWNRLLSERKLGGMAFLRNLRNMKEAGITTTQLRKAIVDVNFNRVLPFRFISAAQYAPSLEDVLEDAMFRALAETPKLTGKTVLVLDNSGSMGWSKVSERSQLTRVDAAAGLAMLLREVCEEIVVIGFGSTAQVLPNRRGFALAEAYRNGPGGGTRTEYAKNLADLEGYDRIIIVTDEQSHESITAPNGIGYVINVATYKNGIGYGAWTHVDGWSESVVKYIQEIEQG